MLHSNISRVLLACTVIILAGCAAVAPSPAQAQNKPNYSMGMNILWGNGDAKGLESRFKRMKSMGITQARTDWEWRVVESQKGVYDWTKMDKMVSLAKQYGVTILPIVHYAPDWALPSTSKPDGVYQLAPRSDAYQAYAKFLAASIDRYGPKGNAKVAFTPITYWQVWNEPNIKEFWGPKPNACGYASMMQTVNKELGSRRSLVKLVHAGISKADFEFLWQLWECNGGYGKLFDVMAVHPYFFNPEGGVRAVDELDKDEAEYAALGVVGSAKDPGYLAKVFNIQLFLTLKGAAKPIWITEIGFMAGDKNAWAIDEKTETDLTAQTLAYIDSRLTTKAFGQGKRASLAANVQRVYWFALDDYGFPDDTGNFGVYRKDGSARPMIDVVKSYTK